MSPMPAQHQAVVRTATERDTQNPVNTRADGADNQVKNEVCFAESALLSVRFFTRDPQLQEQVVQTINTAMPSLLCPSREYEFVE